jgi:nitrile hydratase accessory protein
VTARSLPSDGPVYTEAWQAAAHAIVTALVDAGHFTAAEWSAELGAAIAEAQAGGDPDLGDTYYEHWLTALVSLCAAKNIVPIDELDQRQEAWRQAYLHTPHGQPVELGGAD